MICEKCGTEVDENTSFCPNCGVNLKKGEDNSNEVKKEVKPKKKDSVLSIIAAVFALLAICSKLAIITMPIAFILAVIDLIIGACGDGKRHLGSWFALAVDLIGLVVLIASIGH